MEAPKDIINIISSDEEMAYFFFIFLCKDLVAYYMTPTCKISFLENLGGWQML